MLITCYSRDGNGFTIKTVTGSLLCSNSISLTSFEWRWKISHLQKRLYLHVFFLNQSQYYRIIGSRTFMHWLQITNISNCMQMVIPLESWKLAPNKSWASIIATDSCTWVFQTGKLELLKHQLCDINPLDVTDASPYQPDFFIFVISTILFMDSFFITSPPQMISF